MKVLIVSGGSLDPAFGKAYVKDHCFDRIIAADSGLEHCEALGLMPTDILGDFDSLKQKDLLQKYKEEKVPVRTFPTRKDYTDTDLAIRYAEDIGVTELTILGGTGSRYDHTLANLSLLLPLEKKGIHAKIVDAHNEIEVMIGPCERSYRKDQARDYFSLLSLSESCEGLDLNGFSYPLQDYKLEACLSLGISNEIKEEDALLRFRKGILLVIQAND